MTHKIHMIVDFQFGSTGKGLLAGWLAKREDYDTAICSFAPNAGHTYIDRNRGISMMTQQLPTAISSPTVKQVLIGPGALIHVPTLLAELERYKDLMLGKVLMIHPHAAIVTDEHAQQEYDMGLTKIGSTAKGVGAAMIERIMRRPGPHMNVAAACEALHLYVVSSWDYMRALEEAESIIIEGAQGFSLSMYHGFYPYTTSRDVTPWQIAADCGIPFKWASYIKVYGTMRTLPIRVNNRDGSSGPGYGDQKELTWEQVGVAPEKTTVTKLDRRIFNFSEHQTVDAAWHCGGYWDTSIFLNFCNYVPDHTRDSIISKIETPTPLMLNPPKVRWTGYGPDDADVVYCPPAWDAAPVVADSEGGEA
jgi:adenylosuccinate synthase